MRDGDERKREINRTLKRLRAERDEQLKAVRARTRDVLKLRRKVKKALEDGPQTVLSIASAVGASTDEVLWHVMAMRGYGLVAEDDQEGDYFKYRLVPAAGRGS
jgi:predicted transcriptional regulator